MMADRPARLQPMPMMPLPPWLLYVKDSLGSTPAIPGATRIGTS